MKAEKNILCFGDSNTWGCNPADGSRYDRSTRWPCILQQELGAGYHIIEEGLCGRTTVWEDPIERDKNGAAHLYTMLKTHLPLDLVIIMLGTNDLKCRFSVTAFDIAESAGRLVQVVRETTYPPFCTTPDVLVICPPPTADLEPTPFKDMFHGGEEKSHQLAVHFKATSEKLDFNLLNAAEVIQSSTLDGIHFEASEHVKLGKVLAEEVLNRI
ncbi:SGNH/GDSL hydrolase family protein [Pontiellaceae bacterium B12227]|nr:SGNH/GDSL hydrolase family protein [Pontiellaceae bacterium B12227]